MGGARKKCLPRVQGPVNNKVGPTNISTYIYLTLIFKTSFPSKVLYSPSQALSRYMLCKQWILINRLSVVEKNNRQLLLTDRSSKMSLDRSV